MADYNAFEVYGVKLGKIRNKNEVRVIKAMPGVLKEFADYTPDPLDIEDIYALTLNTLPARYVQQGGIVLREPLSDAIILDEIRKSVNVVRSRPRHGA